MMYDLNNTYDTDRSWRIIIPIIGKQSELEPDHRLNIIRNMISSNWASLINWSVYAGDHFYLENIWSDTQISHPDLIYNCSGSRP